MSNDDVDEFELCDGATVVPLNAQLGALHARSAAGHWSAFALPQLRLAFDWSGPAPPHTRLQTHTKHLLHT